MKTYSMEYRRVVAAAYDQSGSSADVAEQFGCSESWVRRLMQRRRETGSLEPRPPQRPDNNKLKEEDLSELADLIARQPEMTLQELADAASDPGERADGVPRCGEVEAAAKKKSLHAAEQERPDVKSQRAVWFEGFRHVTLDQLIFLDEFGASSNMTRLYARGPRGQRIVCRTPHGHWKMLSTIAAMSTGGILAAGTLRRRWTKTHSWRLCNSAWCPSSRPARSWCWTICRHINRHGSIH